MSFHDWKNQGILLQKTSRNPERQSSLQLEFRYMQVQSN